MKAPQKLSLTAISLGLKNSDWIEVSITPPLKICFLLLTKLLFQNYDPAGSPDFGTDPS
jgi:hypothetical protein